MLDIRFAKVDNAPETIFGQPIWSHFEAEHHGQLLVNIFEACGCKSKQAFPSDPGPATASLIDTTGKTHIAERYADILRRNVSFRGWLLQLT